MKARNLYLLDAINDVTTAARNAERAGAVCECPGMLEDPQDHANQCPAKYLEEIFKACCFAGGTIQRCLDFAQGPRVWNVIEAELSANHQDDVLADLVVTYVLALLGVSALHNDYEAAKAGCIQLLDARDSRTYGATMQAVKNPDVNDDIRGVLLAVLGLATYQETTEPLGRTVATLAKALNAAATCLAAATGTHTKYDLISLASHGFTLVPSSSAANPPALAAL